MAQTARRLAQKQPSFKECVTAHWSMLSRADNVTGLSLPPKPWPSTFGGEGRGAFRPAMKLDRKVGWSGRK